MNPLARERRSRDTRPQPTWRNPATPAMKRETADGPLFSELLYWRRFAP